MHVLETAVTPGTIAFDHCLVGLERDRRCHPRSSFENGATAEADIVIGADGIRSKVRDILLGAEPPRFIGAVAQRAIFPAERLRGHPDAATAPNGGARTATCSPTS